MSEDSFISELDDEGALPLNGIFAGLAEIYKRRNPKSTNITLADHLGIRPQSCSQWKTGTDGRKPTWTAIVSLCGELNMQVIVDGKGTWLRRRRKSRREAKAVVSSDQIDW